MRKLNRFLFNLILLNGLFVVFLSNTLDGSILDWLIKPSLSEEEKEWKMHKRTVDTSDANYPFQIINDGYKFITIKEIEKKGKTDYVVEWGFQFKIKNTSNQNYYVTVNYILKDKDSFQVDQCRTLRYVPAKGEGTIRQTTTMDYSDYKKGVASSSWTISYSENQPYGSFIEGIKHIEQ